MSSAQVSQVIQVLAAAASGDASVRVPAHQQLTELEGRPGFITLLLEAYADASAEMQGRYLAILMCKNVVDRHWQPHSGNCMELEEKRQVKAGLLKLLKLAASGGLPYLTELCLVLRRVCRLDFPRDWDDLAHFVLAELQLVQQQGFNENALGIIVILHHVLKEQASKRLMSSKKDFHKVGQLLMEPLAQVWWLKFERMRQHADTEAANAGMWKLSRHLDGCFLVLLAQGFAHLHELPRGPDMILLGKDNVALLLGILQRHPTVVVQCPFFIKNLKSILKWWAKLMHLHPLAFAKANIAEVLHLSVEILQNFGAPGALQGAERPAVEGMLKSTLQLLTHACNSVVFRKGPQPAHQGVALEAAKACHVQFAEFLQQHHVDALCDVCCHVAFRVDPEEVQAWLADPEDQLQGPGSQTDLHMAGEQLVKALAQAPLDQPLIEHIARRMQEETSKPLSLADPYEVVARKDALFLLLGICQAQLKPHLQFQILLNFFVPLASLVHQMGDGSPAVLLLVRMCWVLKSWSGDMPADAVTPVLQLISAFLQEGSPKAVRMAALGPLRSMLDRFSDHEAWEPVQSAMIDSCLLLLNVLTTPESQWRCLNLVHLFLCEEAESGRYEATQRSLGQLLQLWRRPEESELLICHALLDVLRALVLMSCRSRQPRLPISEPLFSCCLAVVSDCFTHHMGASAASTAGQEAAAALQSDAAAAAECLGQRGGASATLFDSGSLLFLSVLRTVDVAQAGPLLGLFPQLLDHYGKQAATMASGSTIHDHALDILLEYCALYVGLAPGAGQLQPHFEALIRLCRHCLEKSGKDGKTDQCFLLLQLLLGHCPPQATAVLCCLTELLDPLLRLWATNFVPERGPHSLQYPLHSLLGTFCAWQTHHKQHFVQQVCSSTPGTAHVASLIVASTKLVRSVALRVSALSAALSLVEEGGASGETFWRDFWQGCADLIQSAQKRGNSAALSAVLQSLKSSLVTKLPVPALSQLELQRVLLPQEVRPTLKEDSSLDEVAVVRAFFEVSARSLQRLTAAKGVPIQSLLMSAPATVQEAFGAISS